MKKQVLSIIALTLSIIAITLVMFNWQQQPKLGYVKNADLFSAFNGTKELKGKLESSKFQQKAILDSLSLELTNLRERFKAGQKNVLPDLQQKEQIWVGLNQQYNEVYSQKSEEYTDQIWVQINQYILDFGKENGYDYIIGANGAGALMYGSDRTDLTKEVIEYANKRYDGE